ncbi:hypothetical protein GCM10028819_22550 [Spirosoma humi]
MKNQRCRFLQELGNDLIGGLVIIGVFAVCEKQDRYAYLSKIEMVGAINVSLRVWLDIAAWCWSDWYITDSY